MIAGTEVSDDGQADGSDHAGDRNVAREGKHNDKYHDKNPHGSGHQAD